MIAVVIVLYAAAALLPLAGIVHFAIRARDVQRKAVAAAGDPPMIAIRSAEGNVMISNRDLTNAGRAAKAAPFASWRRAVTDLALVGTGLVCGAVASIWSLFLP